MTSRLAWLDHSAEDQRRVRDIIQLFAQSETQDALGLGQVRDAYSDLLFPGTSTLHTRARYLLFVPWCFLVAASGTHDPAVILTRGRKNERQLIVTLKAEPDRTGLIGAQTGPQVRNLPSTIYATALRRFDIQHGEIGTPSPRPRASDGEHESSELTAGVWHRRLPMPPPDFPGSAPGGFALTPAEAEFLQARIAAGAADSLLCHLVTANLGQLDSPTVWQLPLLATASDRVQADVQLARTFSLVTQGASLLYNLLVAEKYERAGFGEVSEPVERYRHRLEQWAVEIDPHLKSLAAWMEVRERAATQNSRVAQNWRLNDFCGRWFDGVRRGAVTTVADDDALRELVHSREVAVKRRQSRLVNEQMLARWGGANGTDAFVYRWPQVQGILNDISTGLRGSDRAPA